jgi:NAD-dependent dihydropyrimidine dehydrogenase PreA subunit
VEILVGRANARGVNVLLIDDLCGAAAQRDQSVLSVVGEGVAVVACFQRAVAWLLRWAGVDVAENQCMDLRSGDADAVLSVLGLLDTEDTTFSVPPTHSCQPVPGTSDWIPWFPIIDYDRCSGCRQCLSFCPFGVYELAGDRVVVQSPRNCKNNCPACARLCPQVAIMFPKLADAPINGRAVREEDIARVRGVLQEQADGEDIHALLARRKLRAAYRKLERQAAAEGRELNPEELTRTMMSERNGGRDA